MFIILKHISLSFHVILFFTDSFQIAFFKIIKLKTPRINNNVPSCFLKILRMFLVIFFFSFHTFVISFNMHFFFLLSTESWHVCPFNWIFKGWAKPFRTTNTRYSSIQRDKIILQVLLIFSLSRAGTCFVGAGTRSWKYKFQFNLILV